MIRRLLVCALPALVSALLLVSGAGCAKRHKINIESNTCWIAVIDREVWIDQDCASATFRVAGEIHCVKVTNLNDTGFVRVRIDDGAWVESTVPRGVVQACR